MPECAETSSHPALRALRAASGAEPAQLSLVQAVLLACELSEDETEVNDLVRDLVETRAARLLPVDRDPMLQRRPCPGRPVTPLTT